MKRPAATFGSHLAMRGAPDGVSGEGWWKDLDRDVATQLCAGAIYLAHAAGAQQRDQLVGAKTLTHQVHGFAPENYCARDFAFGSGQPAPASSGRREKRVPVAELERSPGYCSRLSLGDSQGWRLPREEEVSVLFVTVRERPIETSTAGASFRSVPGMPELSALDQPTTTLVATGEKILELVKRAGILYKTQDPAEQRQLLDSVLSNCTFDRGSVCPTYKKPFDLFI
jgi:hypothetical protein